MEEVKNYYVRGIMLVGESKYPVWQKFEKYVRALNEKQAIEIIYSVLGSNHKIKRYNIKIQEIKEVPLDEVADKKVRDLAKLEKIILE
ncbi:MAG: 50S ribosomal protein L18Ae [Sulfolobaceae archaeon]|nr:50S ribosomal protein L18Ae [Sulfolobaceae archaeon]